MARRSKFGAVATVVDGIRFHSKGEARRWAELKLLERAGQISILRRQIPFILSVKNFRGGDLIELGKYIVDFSYLDGSGHSVYEDFKGFSTPLGAWKIRHAEAEYGIKVRITGAASRKRAT